MSLTKRRLEELVYMLKTLGSRVTEFETFLHPVFGLWEDCFTSWCLGFAICKVGIINTIHTCLDWCLEKVCLALEPEWTLVLDQFSSVAQSCLTLCDPMNHSTPGLCVHHQLPESTQTHVHQVGDAIQPSHPLLLPSPAPSPSQH